MTTYQLISLSPLKLQYKSLNGLPSSLTREAAAPATPDGYKYVENVAMPDDAPEGQYYVRELTADQYGWKLEAIPEVVIESVTRIQMRDVLIDNDLFDTVEATIAAMPEGTDEEIVAKKKMNEWWNNAPNFRRDNARIATMQAAMGLTDAEVDALFLAASQVD
jgi:hypothetical protein